MANFEIASMSAPDPVAGGGQSPVDIEIDNLEFAVNPLGNDTCTDGVNPGHKCTVMLFLWKGSQQGWVNQTNEPVLCVPLFTNKTVRLFYDVPDVNHAIEARVQNWQGQITDTRRLEVSVEEARLEATDVQAPSRILVGQQTGVEATIRNTGGIGGTGYALLTVDGGGITSKEVNVPAGESRQVTLPWTPTRKGSKRVCVQVV